MSETDLSARRGDVRREALQLGDSPTNPKGGGGRITGDQSPSQHLELQSTVVTTTSRSPVSATAETSLRTSTAMDTSITATTPSGGRHKVPARSGATSPRSPKQLKEEESTRATRLKKSPDKRGGGVNGGGGGVGVGVKSGTEPTSMDQGGDPLEILELETSPRQLSLETKSPSQEPGQRIETLVTIETRKHGNNNRTASTSSLTAKKTVSVKKDVATSTRRDSESQASSRCSSPPSVKRIAVSTSGGEGTESRKRSPLHSPAMAIETSSLSSNNKNAGTPGGGKDGGSSGDAKSQQEKTSRGCCFCCITVSNDQDNNANKKDDNKQDTLNGDNEALPSLEDIRAWGESFDKLMKHGAGRKLFRDFLQCEYSEENILFWLACEDLKKESDAEVIEEKARLIYEDYISILSPKEVSLDSKVRELINRNMVEPSPHTFDDAQLQIYTLMHRDSYPRFVNSSLFRKLAQINSNSRKDSQVTCS